MAIFKAVSSKAGIGAVIDYITKEEKTEEKLISGKDCNPKTAKEEMQATKLIYQKTGGRTYKHFVQSFHNKENITLEQAHKIAKDFSGGCKQFEGFEVLIATHKDKNHIHSHFVVNSVSFKDGHKFNMHRNELQEMKELSDRLCQGQGLHICEKGKTFEGAEREETSAYKKESYQFLKKAEQGKVKSYIQEIGLAALQCKESAISREDFISKMDEKGFKVDWKENHKYITFTDLTRENRGDRLCKIRNNKLEKYYNINLGKETLENEFKRNLQREETIRNSINEQFREVASPQSNVKDGAGELFIERSLSGVSERIAAIQKGAEKGIRGYRESLQDDRNKGKQPRKFESDTEREYEVDNEPSRRIHRERDWELER